MKKTAIKKIITIALLGLFSLGLTGCGTTSGRSAGSSSGGGSSQHGGGKKVYEDGELGFYN